ncbi:LPXTG cell wall anchor domain-containing protein [Proteiniclasticum sp. SCR006]|uniref:LPXTG cell wall anchor domain-containing protein n=1 Tax=Proteiniclasticum aestuarii TaxID=2817862 RepID=A0A939H9Q0_9CLOT|nr:LPXTG cell wall anchor domain-containing protein [Proteiniclasticum aestuarii]MBO1264056.1 LPXTG cell wall anchor domain-containing protein [Proteiniclasticum aestuarii]
MRNVKRSLTSLILFVFISAIFFQNLAYGIPLEEENSVEVNPITVQAATALRVDQQINLDVLVVGDVSVQSVTAYYEITGKNEGEISYSLNQNPDEGFSYSISLQDYNVSESLSGTYRMKKLEVETYDNDIYHIYEEGTSGVDLTHDFSAMDFEISRLYDDLQIDASMPDTILTAGEQLEIALSTTNLPAHNVQFYFINENGNEINVGGDLNSEMGIRYSISDYTAPGTYQLVYVNLAIDEWITIHNSEYDDILHMYMQDFSHLDFVVEGTVADNEAPVFDHINMINSKGTAYAPLVMELIAHDEVSGLESGSATFVNEDYDTFEVYFSEFDNFKATMNVDSSIKEGTYHMMSVSINDKAGNHIHYRDHRYVQNEWHSVSDLSMYVVEISETFSGYDPKISIVEPSKIKVGESGEIIVLHEDENYSPDSILLHYSYKSYYENFAVELTRESEGVYRGALDSTSFDKMGDYHLTYMNLQVKGKTVRSIYDSNRYQHEQYMEDLSGGLVTVYDPAYEKFPQVSVTPSKKEYSLFDTLILEMDFDVEGFYPEYIEGLLVNQSDEETTYPVYFRYDETLMRYVYISKIDNRIASGTYALTDLKALVNHQNDVPLSSDYNEVIFTINGTVGEGYIPEISITVDKKEAKPGDVVTITAEIDETDVDFFSVILSMVIGNDSELSHHTLEEVRSGVFELKIPIETHMNNGSVTIEYISLEGMAHYVGSSREDDNKLAEAIKNSSFSITGATGDQTAPKLVDITLDKNVFYFMENPELGFEILEDGSGFDRGYIEYKRKGTDIIIDGGISAYGDKISASMYSWYMDEGIYELQSITLYDKAGNKAVYNSENSPLDFSKYTFEMKTAYLENFSIKTDKETYGPYDTVNISGMLGLTDVGTGRLDLRYEDQSGNWRYVSADVKNDGSFSAKMEVMPNEAEGKYVLVSIDYFHGETRYEMIHGNPSEGKNYADLSGGNYEIKGTVEDYEEPVLKSVKLDKNIAVPGEVITITVVAEDNKLGLHSGSLEFYNKEFNKKIQVELIKTSETTMTGKTTISDTEVSGQWVLTKVNLEDKGTNRGTTYNKNLNLTTGMNVMDFSANSFTTEKTVPDLTAPEFISAEIRTNHINNFTPLEITIKAKDSESGIKDVIVYYENEGGGRDDYSTFKAKKIGEDTYKVVENFDVFARHNLYIHKIELIDYQNNRCIISYWHNDEYLNKYDRIIYTDLSRFDIELYKEDQQKEIEEAINDIAETVVQTENKAEIIQMKDTLLNMKETMDQLEDTPENQEKKEQYYELLQNVLKVDKVVENTDVEESQETGMDMSVSNLNALHLPEVLDEEVKSVKIELKAEAMSKEDAERIVSKAEAGTSVVALYDMSLFKVVERTDNSSSSDSISNEDIKGLLTLRMAVPLTYMGSQNLKVIYVNENGEMEELEAEDITENGIRYLYFQTDHFSMYGIITTAAEDSEEDTPVTPETPEEESPVTPETPDEDITDIPENDQEEIIDEETNLEESEEDESDENDIDESDKTSTDDSSLPKAGAADQSMFLYGGAAFILLGVFMLKKKSANKIAKQ